MTTSHIDNYDQDFPMLSQKMNGHRLIYFDNGATTLKPQCVIDAISNFYKSSYGTVHRAVYELAKHSDAQFHQARVAVQKLINANSEKEIIFTSGTTDAINKLALSFGEAFIHEGDEILISEIEHHSNLVPWQMLAKRSKAVLKFIPTSDDGEIDLNAMRSLLSEKVKLVSLAHISNVTGTCHLVKEIIKLVRSSCPAKVLIDGAQAIAHMPVDVKNIDADFYVFSAHKMYGPTGIGVLYGKENLLEAMPPVFGGGDMIDHVSLEKTSYNKLPYKFEAGTPNIAGVIGLKAAVEYLLSIGYEKIQKQESKLLAYALKELKKIPALKLVAEPKNQAALISFYVEGIHNLDLASLLNFKGVATRSGHLCAQPALEKFGVSSILRISFAFYNTQSEIEMFIEHLKSAISKLS
ncbi:MAG: Cysteine desulfurase [Chlamydiae bacterium]|nr:Cysteine desulfurase [Chlamydiota bacterium]